jgi:hypothetical protein
MASPHDERLSRLFDDSAVLPDPIEKEYPESVSRVIERAIGEALAGFTCLYEAGYLINRVQAMGIMRYLFRLRGVKNLLALLPEHCGTTLSATCTECFVIFPAAVYYPGEDIPSVQSYRVLQCETE